MKTGSMETDKTNMIATESSKHCQQPTPNTTIDAMIIVRLTRPLSVHRTSTNTVHTDGNYCLQHDLVHSALVKNELLIQFRVDSSVGQIYPMTNGQDEAHSKYVCLI